MKSDARMIMTDAKVGDYLAFIEDVSGQFCSGEPFEPDELRNWASGAPGETPDLPFAPRVTAPGDNASANEIWSPYDARSPPQTETTDPQDSVFDEGPG